MDRLTRFQQVNALNQGTESNSSISLPMLEALAPDDEANTRDPDHQFYISYDFYAKNNPHYHPKDLYGFKDGNYYQTVILSYVRVNDQCLLVSAVVKNTQRLFTPQLNYISMKLTDFPLLSQRDSIQPGQFCNESTVSGCEEDYCSCTHVLQVKLGSVVELVLVDKGKFIIEIHPFNVVRDVNLIILQASPTTRITRSTFMVTISES